MKASRHQKQDIHRPEKGRHEMPGSQDTTGASAHGENADHPHGKEWGQRIFDSQLLVEHSSISPWLPTSDRPAVVEALEVAFLASLHMDEGRPLEFVLAIASQLRDFPNATKLEASEPLTPDMLKALSAILDPEEQCFVVVPTDNGLTIQAVAQRPRPSQPGGIAPPLVVVDGPGRVALIISETSLLYDRGRLQEDNRRPFRQWARQSVQFVVDHVSTPTRLNNCLPVGIDAAFEYDVAKWTAHCSAFRDHARKYAPELLADVARLIAKRIKSARHGGAVLLVPSGANLKEIAVDGRWFENGDRDLQNRVLEAASLRSHLDLALDGKLVVKGLRKEFQKDPARWAREVISPRFQDALRNLDSACQRCARLSQVDGATILSSDLRVVGFGTRLKAPPRRLPTACKTLLKSRGTRHSSMAYTVASLESAIGIVVSQDGNAVAFHRPPRGELQFHDLIL